MNLLRKGLSFFVLLVFGIALAAHGQATNGTIAGTIVDPTGAAIGGATVTATNIQTGIGRTATTNKVGGYRIESVQPGNYKVVVNAPSFAETTVEQAVTASVITSVNATLGVGTANATVEVGAVTAGLRTESGELSETLSTVEIQNLPIASLNPYALVFTLPGITHVTASDFTQGASNQTSFSANGNRPRDNNFLIEGADNNEQGVHGQAFQPENLDAVQEVTFLLSSFSPEYGGGGSVSNLLLQSGTNHFHGAVFERLFNSSLDATDHSVVLNQQSGGTGIKSKSRENLFGVRIGGPILHDRAFFFGSALWDRIRGSADASVLTVPTAAGYAVLNQYASNPRIANLIKAYGGLVGTNTAEAKSEDLGMGRGVVNFAGVQRSLSSDENIREIEATTDVKFSDADKIRFRFIQSPLSVPVDATSFPAQLPGFDTYQDGIVYNTGITETHIFNDHFLNELRLSYGRIGFNFGLRPETVANPLALSPSISFGDGVTDITGFGIPAGLVPQGTLQNTYQLQDALTLTLGRHTLKVGFDVDTTRHRDSIPWNYYGAIPYQAVPGLYSPLANYFDDFSGTGVNGTATISFGNPVTRPTLWSQSYYVQDSWKALSNLEVDFGLRYEYHGTPLNFLGYPGFNASNPSAFPSGLPEVGDKNDLGPRFGFNYQPIPGGKYAISGGVGIFYSHLFTNVIDNIQGSSPNTAAKSISPGGSGRGTPNWSNILTVCSTCAIKTKSPLATDTANVISPNLVDPLTYEYNLRLQRELPGSFVLAVQYAGNRTEKDYATEEYNPITPSGRLIPGRGRIILEDNGADSNYNSLEADLEHRTRHGLAMRAAYTYSKLLDDGSEIFTDTSGSQISTYAEIQRTGRAREYADSAFDHRHRFVASVVYQPPTWHTSGGERLLGAVINGFTFSGVTSFQSGQPENVEIGFDWNQDGIGNDRPILLNKNAPITHWAIKGDDPIVGYGLPAGTLCDGPEAFATADDCKVVSAADTHWVTSYFGTTQNTIGRNALKTDHFVDTDLTVQRSFAITEHQLLDFRIEALNAFNQGNTGSYNANLVAGVPFNGTDNTGQVFSGATTFGNRYLTTVGGRVVRFLIHYQF